MKNLQLYIDKKNFMNDLFKQPLIDINNLSLDDVQDLFDSLECDMSPENVSCDGECSRAEVTKRLKFYKAVASDLATLGFKEAR